GAGAASPPTRAAPTHSPHRATAVAQTSWCSPLMEARVAGSAGRSAARADEDERPSRTLRYGEEASPKSNAADGRPPPPLPAEAGDEGTGDHDLHAPVLLPALGSVVGGDGHALAEALGR